MPIRQAIFSHIRPTSRRKTRPRPARKSETAPSGRQSRTTYGTFVAIGVVLAFIAGPAPADDLKASIVAGYLKRCIEVRTQAGWNADKVDASCHCEASVIDADYSTFSLMSLVVRGEIDKRLVSQAEIQAFRQKISACNSN